MSRRPNILFLMCDQFRHDALGCVGGWTRTANLDRIAAEGTRFDGCLTNSPVCIPARVSLATGLYPHNTGVWKNLHYTISPSARTWMQAIREAGYRTSVIGKTHLHPHGGDLRDREDLLRGLGLDDIDEIGGPRASQHLRSHMTERWERLGLWEKYQADYGERFGNNPLVARPSALPLEEYADVYVGQQGRRYLEGYDRDEPWCCWISFGGPHEPWDAPEPYASMYAPSDMPPARPAPEGLGEAPDNVLSRRIAADRERIARADVPAMRANYAGNVTLIDDQIGEILSAIEARGELENTVIAFTSDHGEMNGDAGIAYKEAFLDGAARVPMLLRVPGHAGGAVCQTPIEWMDLGATLAELAGGQIDYPQYARSMTPLLANPAGRIREIAVCEYRHEICADDGRWKLAINADGEPYLLIDRASDPLESANRLHDPSAQGEIARLREAIFHHLMATPTQYHAR